MIATDEDDTSFMSTATVTISIMDTNDNSPKFPEDTYKLSVTEHSPVGTIIANITVRVYYLNSYSQFELACKKRTQWMTRSFFSRRRTPTQWIKATSPTNFSQRACVCALGPNCSYSAHLRTTEHLYLYLSFRLLYFDVEPQTGSVYVKNSTLLDREVRSLYSVTLQARDTDNKPGSTVLEISVTDINDQRPVFNRDSYLVFVEEGRNLELTIEVTIYISHRS